MKRWSVDVHLKGDAKCTHPHRVRVWFDPSVDVEEHRRDVRESLSVVREVLLKDGVLYLPTSSRSTYWVHTRDVAGVEVVGPEGEEL